MEYCVQAWSPSLLTDINKLVRLQTAANPLVPSLRGLPYKANLNHFKLILQEFVGMVNYILNAT